jgi:hypothetical protein
LQGKSPGTWRLMLTAAKVAVDGQGARAEGKDDVDLDIFFATPAGLKLKTEPVSVTSPGVVNGVFTRQTTTQTALVAAAPNGGWLLAVLYPRLKTEKAAVLTALAEGKGVKVQSAAGTDYVFVAPGPFSFRDVGGDGEIVFHGTVGAVQLRGKRSVLSLGAAGSISAKGQTLKSDQAASQAW